MAIDPELLKQIEQPLTQENQTDLQDAIDISTPLKQLIDRAKRAGIDTGDTEAQVDEQVKQATRIRDEFFPGGGY